MLSAYGRKPICFTCNSRFQSFLDRPARLLFDPVQSRRRWRNHRGQCGAGFYSTIRNEENMYRVVTLGVLLLFQGLAPVQAGENGLEIAQAAEEKFSQYRDSRGEAVMTIRTKDGDEAERRLQARNLRLPEGSRSLTIIQSPRDVSGTALLTHSNDGAADDQWLFLPALKRVKRIAPGNRSGAFMGSEFSYADFTAQPVEDFEFKWLREETLDDQPCHVIERTPRDENAVYSRQVAWLDKAELRTHRVDFYNRAGQKLKTLRAEDFRQYDNGQWRAARLLMTNHLTGGRSVLEWQEIEFDNGFQERDFSLRALKRAR